MLDRRALLLFAPLLLACGGAGTTPPPAAQAPARAATGPDVFALDLGCVYWRRVDFVEAAYAAKDVATPEGRLVLATALALARGPNGAAEMMRAPSAAPSTRDVGHTETLDALVAEGGPLAGLAAYDAAHLRALSLPEGAAATPRLEDVAARFHHAERLLSDAAHQRLAAQRAADVAATLAAGKAER